MEAYDLKQYLRDNNKVQEVLESIGMHHVVYHDSGYYSCGMPDGDNNSSTIIYDNEWLTTIAHTRNINPNKNMQSDIFTLIQFVKDYIFPQALNYVCELTGVEYYEDFEKDLPESILFLRELNDLKNETQDSTDRFKTKIRDIKILDYYSKNVNDLFYNDGIGYQTQREFHVGFDDCSNRITIPIFNELNQLVGVKGRLLENDSTEEDKYIYLERCNKSHILYALNMTYQEIIRKGFVYVGESEKFPMQLWSNEIYNSTALGGHSISRYQLLLLQRLGVKIILCFDKDISQEEIEYECSKFESWCEVYYMLDCDNLLTGKESPSDDINKFKILNEKYTFRYIKK